MFNTILLPIDLSAPASWSKALPAALDLATASGGKQDKPKKKTLAQHAQDMVDALPSEPPLANKSKRSVFPKPNSKWLGALGKRN